MVTMVGMDDLNLQVYMSELSTYKIIVKLNMDNMGFEYGRTINLF